MEGFDQIIDELRRTLALLPDQRTGSNTQYSMQDAGLAAFSVFFMQSSSFLAAQRAMQENKGRSNAGTLFKTTRIPTDNHVRSLLDPVEPKALFPVYDRILAAMRAQGVLDGFRSVGGTQLIALDGTWYHSSGKIHCDNCSTREHKDGSTTYHHSAITPVVVTPGRSQAIALRP